MTKKVIGIAAALVLFAALVLPLNAQLSSVLHEEFEGTFPPTDWTTTNDGGNNQWFTNSYWGRSNYAGGSGMCADNDDDAAGSGAPWCQNNALVTPSMDLSTATEAWLAYTISYNLLSSSNEHARIEVYDGSSWQNIITYTSDQDAYGPGKRDSFDISSYAAGEANVQVRFVYNEINYAGWYWWLEIDNVDVWADVGGEVPHFVDTLLCEHFETPRPNWLPAGWDTIQTNPLEPWQPTYPHSMHWWHWEQGDLLYGPDYAHDNGVACCWWDNNMSPYFQDEWLITPPLALTDPEYTAVTLAFSSAFYRGVPHNYVCVSTNGGATWQDTLIDLTHDVAGSDYLYIDDYPNPFEFDLSGYLGQTIRIGFNYWDNTLSTAGLQTVDDVCVFASGGSGGPSEDSLDLALMAIIRPHTKEEPNVPFTPEILVVNNLDTTAHARLSCRIKELAGSTVYEDVLSVVPLESGKNFVRGFNDFTPESGKKYNALFVLEHPDDVNPDNDNKDKNFEAEVGMDVTPFEILAPAEVQDGSFSPAANYAEKAGADTTEANLICEIMDESSASVYKESVSHTFVASETWTATFAPDPVLESGTYTITFWAENPLDGSNISFPDTTMTFIYTTGIAETPLPERTSLEVLGTRVNFTLATATNVNLRIYDVAGNVVTELVSESRGPGSYTINWNTDGVASGIYFVRMLTPEFNATRKVLILH